MEVEEFLEHFGVKGMKWGIRRKVGSDGRVTGSVDHRTTQQLKAKPVHQLTNMQLKKLNERMNLEQNYNRLNPKKVSHGKKIVAGIIASAGIGVKAYNQFNSPAGKAAIKHGKKVMAASQKAKADKAAAKLINQVAKGNFG